MEFNFEFEASLKLFLGLSFSILQVDTTGQLECDFADQSLSLLEIVYCYMLYHKKKAGQERQGVVIDVSLGSLGAYA